MLGLLLYKYGSTCEPAGHDESDAKTTG